MTSIKDYLPILVVLIIGVIVVFINGNALPFADIEASTEPECPVCSNPSKWSECSEEGIKTRVNYVCSEETNYTCESYTEEKACQTEIRSMNEMVLEVVITPTLDDTVEGIIKVEAVAVPEGTEEVIFFFMPAGVQLGARMTEEELVEVVQEEDSNGNDGWKTYFDVTDVENGL